MARIVLVSLLLVSGVLAVSCSASLSFKDLNNWLTRNVDKSKDLSANLDAAARHFENDEPSANKEAAKALESLVALSKVTKCSDDVLAQLRAIEGGLTSDTKRVNQIVGQLLNNFAADCEYYLDRRVVSLYSQLDQNKVGALLKQLKPHVDDFVPALVRKTSRGSGQAFFETYLSRHGLSRKDRSDSQLAADVVQLNKGDSINNAADFQRAFKANLAEPCEYFNGIMENLLEGAYALKFIGQHSIEATIGADLIRDRSAEFKDALYYYKTCYKITGLKKEELDQIYRLMR